MSGNRTIRYFSAYIKNLPHLATNERIVLFLRLRGMTLVTIGKKLTVTEGRVRQIEAEALKKVKSKKVQQSLFKKYFR